jgi:methionyl-tRNA formyltransferase
MKIVFYGYRDWALDIFSKIKDTEKYLVTHKDYDIISNIKPDLVFFIGWSSIVPEDIIQNYKCICLHPSLLPKYRGGSPIQHQLINNESTGGVTLFLMDHGIDTGDILYQSKISLQGSLNNIFVEIKREGIKGIETIIDSYQTIDKLKMKQDSAQATFFNRRNEAQSEITFEEIKANDPVYLYNKIRSLNDPYPNAYIKCKDGRKLYIIESKYEK